MQATDEQQGDMPTTGALRPGPVALSQGGRGAREGDDDSPIAIRIVSIQVDTVVERAYIVDDAMQDPSGPFVVAWYSELARVGVPGNAVFSGHVDYVGVGPAVFYGLGLLAPGDEIEVTGATGTVFVFEVDWVETYLADSAPVGDILEQGEAEEITLITCGGSFDESTGLYSDRLIVRATRTS